MENKEYAIEVEDLRIRYKCLNKVSIKKSLRQCAEFPLKSRREKLWGLWGKTAVVSLLC